MSAVPVQVVVYGADMEFTINVRGDATLGNLRDVMQSYVGKARSLTCLWVAFTDEGKATLPFSMAEKESDALQLKFLRCSDRQDSPVSVGAFAFSQ